MYQFNKILTFHDLDCCIPSLCNLPLIILTVASLVILKESTSLTTCRIRGKLSNICFSPAHFPQIISRDVAAMLESLGMRRHSSNSCITASKLNKLTLQGPAYYHHNTLISFSEKYKCIKKNSIWLCKCSIFSHCNNNLALRRQSATSSIKKKKSKYCVNHDAIIFVTEVKYTFTKRYHDSDLLIHTQNGGVVLYPLIKLSQQGYAGKSQCYMLSIGRITILGQNCVNYLWYYNIFFTTNRLTNNKITKHSDISTLQYNKYDWWKLTGQYLSPLLTSQTGKTRIYSTEEQV